LTEETAELATEMAPGADADQARLEDELGDLLFTCVNMSRKLGIDPETALRKGNAKFERRFKAMESLLASEGKTPASSDLKEMDALWTKAKTQV
jgi:uncharacterized protein YabN with tetrapyrrole methylase and pyrophosphatase domain